MNKIYETTYHVNGRRDPHPGEVLDYNISS